VGVAKVEGNMKSHRVFKHSKKEKGENLYIRFFLSGKIPDGASSILRMVESDDDMLFSGVIPELSSFSISGS